MTDTGMDVYDAPVYLFTDTGSYLGRMERTDSAGRTGFLLPTRSYKFRVDYNGNQYWSDVVNILADEETEVSLALDLLALDLTNDPNPVRFDGIPPEVEPVLLASLFDIPGILTQAIVANTGGAGAVYYFINDHLGTPKKIMDEGGQVVWEADYKPFGEASVTTSTLENGFRFPGQYYDNETGLHYNYHRYYDPMLGRYLRADPIGLRGGINLYQYASANPINAIDPFGLAEYLVAWSTVSGTFDVGGLTMSGAVIDPRPIRSKTDGSIIGYNALEFRGAFIGFSKSSPISWPTNVAIFEDNLPNPDLFNIEGDSLISNNCPGSKTHFGNLIFKKKISSRGFNFELFSGFTGNIEAARSSFILSKEGYDEMVSGKY